ncbi:molybdenum cofactor guanylyltransferase [Ghiorsea bivora]|uniref:molybdenum cofactor guanylyltransferase n=1 Tax=Ghiorsea bivora TaxID=1485545 RepID=UPI00056E516E|nr:molybdenum cofactor guanylyltransferase [Ghiorsea bivora]
MIKNCTAVILAGGESKRMRRDKAGVMFQGKTLLQHAESNLTPLFQSVVVSSREKRNDTQLLQILDTSESRAPMLGIAACFEALDTDWLFVVGVDMPFVAPSLVRFMTTNREDFDAVTLKVDGVLQPLCCFYHRKSLPHMQRNIRADKRSLKHLLMAMNTKVIPENEASVYDAGLRSVVSLDTAQDLQGWSEA